MLVFEETLAQHPLVNQSVDLGEATRRLAIVNLDWDQIKAIDILHMLHGFKPVTGVIESVKIYPSDFGKERMAKEAVEGPPKDIFKEGESDDSSHDSSDEDKGKEPLKPLMVDEGQDFDEVQLRKYQLERLRYYYAVVTCDSRETASAIYKQCDGTEFEMSANFLDLRYIPEGVSFDDDVPTDVADHTQKGYKPKTDLVTPALQQSKVKLTWDMDDPDRARLTKIDFAKFDYNENDLKAYLASSSEEDEEEESEDEGKMDYRALLLGGTSTDVFGRKSHDDNENLQITFTSGFGDHLNIDDVGSDDDVHMEATFDLSEDDNAQEEKENKDETVFEAQLRKMREKKKAKKEARLAKIQETKDAERAERKAQTKKAKKQRTGKIDLDPEQSRRAAELDLLMLEDQPAAADGTKGKHFDMSEIIKSSKKKSKRSKTNVDPDEFKLDVQDDRFKAIFEEPSYAIDPTHSSFKATNAMRSLIDERQRRNKSRHK